VNLEFPGVIVSLTAEALVLCNENPLKVNLLLGRGARTSEGCLATGMSTDAVVVACTGRGDSLPYAGPATPVGWLIGRSVRQALGEALG